MTRYPLLLPQKHVSSQTPLNSGVIQPSAVTEEEQLLPSSALAKAIRSGNEYGWTLTDVPEVINAAEAIGLANLGGQPQFIFPDATCELYWLNAYPGARGEEKAWTDYVHRSARGTREAFERICSETDFEEAARQFAYLAEKLDRGEDIMPHLHFILYFDTEPAV